MNFIVALVFFIIANYQMQEREMPFWERFGVFICIMLGCAFIR